MQNEMPHEVWFRETFTEQIPISRSTVVLFTKPYANWCFLI